MERVRYRLAWVAVAAGVIGLAIYAWVAFHDSRRGDGNGGHTFIDFGGQWYMGRMVVLGQGRDLYHRNVIRPMLESAYPQELEVPWDQLTEEEKKSFEHDADGLMSGLMGEEDRDAVAALGAPLTVQDPLQAAVQVVYETATWPPAKQPAWSTQRLTEALHDRGGALYPPLQGFVYAPLGLFSPWTAYRLAQICNIVLAFWTGWGVCLITGRRVWLPVAIFCVLFFPGYLAGVVLGQNPPLTLAILVWGWVLLQRGRPGWAGVTWGLLAFKPTWAVAFFLVPVLMGRWRMCLGMVLTGLGLVLCTLPVVGVEAWRDWLAVGQQGALWYAGDPNWIHIGRDVLNIPRRFLDFEHTTAQQRWENIPTMIAGWCLLGSTIGFTIFVTLRRRGMLQAGTGVPAAFLLLGAWLSCFHFMYYDALLTAPAIFLLFADLRPYLQPWPIHSFTSPAASALDSPARGSWVLNRVEPTLVLTFVVCALNLPLEWLPFDTFAIILLWLWCGVRVLREPAG